MCLSETGLKLSGLSSLGRFRPRSGHDLGSLKFISFATGKFQTDVPILLLPQGERDLSSKHRPNGGRNSGGAALLRSCCRAAPCCGPGHLSELEIFFSDQIILIKQLPVVSHVNKTHCQVKAVMEVVNVSLNCG